MRLTSKLHVRVDYNIHRIESSLTVRTVVKVLSPLSVCPLSGEREGRVGSRGRSTAPPTAARGGTTERPHVAIDGAQAARCQGRMLVLHSDSRPQEARWRFHGASGGRGWRSARLSRRNTPLSALRSPARSRSSGSGGYFATRDELRSLPYTRRHEMK